MKEFRPRCKMCRHEFHAEGPCTGWDPNRGRPCACEGAWYETEKAISGFCYVLLGVSRDTERASHAACPGADYYYPCECDCHDDLEGS